MRRRLKTSKKEKKEPLKSKPKAVAPKKEKKVMEEKVERKGMQIRVIGHPRVKTAEEIKADDKKDFALSREEAIARRLEEIKQKEIEKTLAPDLGLPGPTKSVIEVERHKQIIMWSGITFFMVLITFFWINNTRRVVDESRDELNKKDAYGAEWEKAVNELSDKIVELKSGVESIDNFGKKGTSTSSGLSTSTLSSILKNASSSVNINSGLPENESAEPVLDLNKEEFEKINQKIEPEIKDKIRFIY